MNKQKFPFLKFKNKETEIAIHDIISMYEGIPNESDINDYILTCYAKNKAELIVEARKILIEFQLKHQEFLKSFVDFKGIIDYVMADLMIERINLGNKYLERLKENGRSRRSI